MWSFNEKKSTVNTLKINDGTLVIIVTTKTKFKWIFERTQARYVVFESNKDKTKSLEV